MQSLHNTPKAPRWISTEAGQWAWLEDSEWRIIAANALSVQERRQLLDTAEQLYLDAEPVEQAG